MSNVSVNRAPAFSFLFQDYKFLDINLIILELMLPCGLIMLDASRSVVRGSLNKSNMEKIESNVFFLHSLWKLDLALWLRACLHGGGGPQIGEVTCGGSPHLSCKRDQINMRYYMDKRVTSVTEGPLPPCKQARKTRSVNEGLIQVPSRWSSLN